jgi:hypothetical protein
VKVRRGRLGPVRVLHRRLVHAWAGGTRISNVCRLYYDPHSLIYRKATRLVSPGMRKRARRRVSGQGVRTTFVRLRSPRRRYRQHEVLTRSRRFFAQQCLPERSVSLSIACNIHRARLNCLVTSCASLLNRSRRKKYDKAKQGRTGVKVKRGSHLDASSASPATQCALCDKGQHRSCAGLAHCTARKRSPPGINKRKEGALGA